MAENKKHRKRSFILSFCIVALVAYFAISFFSEINTISNTKKEITAVKQSTQAYEQKSAELREDLESGDLDEYAETIARDKLGYVMPGERVYYDISVTG